MKTVELIAMLANQPEAVNTRVARQHFAAAVLGGIVVAVLLVASLLGVRADILHAITLPMFWIKLLFPAAVAAAMLYTVYRLGRPGAALGKAPYALLAVMAAMLALGLLAYFAAAPESRAALLFGRTWLFCLIVIPLLSIPVFAAMLWALSALAPTRLQWAGAAAGLLAGAVAASAYALHCPELAAPFIATWYTLGMLIPAFIGYLVGPRLLRW